MTNILYTITSHGDESNVTVILPGEPPLVAHSSHPNYDEIVERVLDGDVEGLPALFDTSVTVAQRFDSLSERVKVANGRVYFDGDEIDSALTRQIVRVLQEADDPESYKALVNFFEKVQQNPNAHSQEQLYEWLTRHDFTITPEGDMVAYKGVRADLGSIHSGPAIVDGEAVNGSVPNRLGAVVEIARSYVAHDPSQGCARGLHVGTYKYASGWAQGALLEVHVNPRDVVSVPTDCDAQKVRVSRYRVVKTIDAEYAAPVLVSDEYDYEDVDRCDDCGDDMDDCFCGF